MNIIAAWELALQAAKLRERPHHLLTFFPPSDPTSRIASAQLSAALLPLPRPIETLCACDKPRSSTLPLCAPLFYIFRGRIPFERSITIAHIPHTARSSARLAAGVVHRGGGGGGSIRSVQLW